VGRFQAPLTILLAQFVHQILKAGRKKRRGGMKILLQPLAYGIADRSARPPIDFSTEFANSTVHDEFRDRFDAC
jgi:hypothetical protein